MMVEAFKAAISRREVLTHMIWHCSDGRVAPLIEQRARLLRQDRIRRNLSRKLETRPGPLELVTRKILQADADLEQAIEGGSLLCATIELAQTEKADLHEFFVCNRNESPCSLAFRQTSSFNTLRKVLFFFFSYK